MAFPLKHSIQSKGRLLDLGSPVVMGILNATPDSFFIGSRIEAGKVADTAGKMLEDGAKILDLGGQSTRPGAVLIDSNEESDRALPLIEIVRSNFPECWISIDTFYSVVAKNAVIAGADIINDISAGDDDPQMLSVISELNVPFIAMHKRGKPVDMQVQPTYDNVVTDVLKYLRDKKFELETLGIFDWIADPGFGFGKTTDHNYQLLNHLDVLKIIGRPILVGVSRKGMIQKALGVRPEEALNGTTALHMAALERGADILRAHDVKEARQCIDLFHWLTKY